jgi:F0F1-type ATP synthase membrane subunit b/b'
MNYDSIAFWSQIAGFVLFALALVWAWNQWITPALAASAKASNDRIALGERHRDEMYAAVESLRRAIDGAKFDTHAMIARVKERAQHERDAILADAKDAGERLVRNAEGELARARMAARDQLRETLADKALEIARTSAQMRIDSTTNARLVKEFVERVSRG